MKKQLFYIEFIFIVFVFIIPPLLYNHVPSGIHEAIYPLPVFFNGIVAILLFAQLKPFYFKKNVNRNIFTAVIESGVMLVTFGGLCLIAVLIQFFSILFSISQNNYTVIFPHTILGIINCVTGTISAAFFEEVIYRFYLPESIRVITKNKCIPCVEIITVIIFALSHRYLGFMSVIDAAGGAIILRFGLKKSGTIWTSTAAHALYNFCMIAVSARFS